MFIFRKKENKQHEYVKRVSKDRIAKNSIQIYNEHRANNRSRDKEEIESLGKQIQKKINLPPINQPHNYQLQEEQGKTFEPDDAEINFLGLNQIQAQNQNQQFMPQQINRSFLQVNVQPIYKYGKLRPDTEQILPILMKVKSSIEATYKNNFQNTDIIIVLDNNINLNNLDMIQMKKSFQQLINSLDNSYKIILLLQDKVFKPEQSVQKQKLIRKFVEKLQPQNNNSFSIKNIIQKLNALRGNRISQEITKIIFFYHYQEDLTSQIYQHLIKNYYQYYFYLLEFGNINNILFQPQQNLDNALYYRINQYEDILNVIKSLNNNEFLTNCKILIKCLSIQNAGQIQLNNVYHNIQLNEDYQFEISLQNLPYNFKNCYAFDVILPQTGINYQYQQQVDILEVQIQYFDQVNQNNHFNEKQIISLNLIQNHIVIPTDSLNLRSALLFYRHFTYYYLEYNRSKSLIQVKQIKNWLLRQLIRNQQILERTEDLQQLIIQF